MSLVTETKQPQVSFKQHEIYNKQFFLIWLLITCSNALAQSYKYDAPVTLEGVLISSIADSSITSDEKQHKFPALKLKNPISVLCAPSETECQPEMGVTLLHLSLKQQQIVKFNNLKGKTAKLKGTLFHSDNGNHYTSVLFDVESISQ